MIKVIRDGKNVVILLSRDEFQSTGKGVVARRLRERRQIKSTFKYKYRS